jgi:Putative Actinobacterial Holin-X, holin superfamily III
VSAERRGDLRDKPVGELIGELGNEVAQLVRQELELAKATLREEVERTGARLREDVEAARQEMADKGRHAGRAAGLGGAGMVAAVVALGTLTAFLVLALDGVMADWLAALIVGLAWAAIALVLVTMARGEARSIGGVAPRALDRLKSDARQGIGGVQADVKQSVESIKEDVQWERTHSGSEQTSSRRASE